MEKPKNLRLNKYVIAACDDRFYYRDTNRTLPAGVFISSDGGISAKKARELARWLIKAAKWADKENSPDLIPAKKGRKK